MGAVSLLLLLVTLAHCGSAPPMRTPEASPGEAAPPEPLEAPMRPREDVASAGRNLEAGLYALKVDGFEPAVVALPAGPVRRRPLLIAAHGAGCLPEYHCALWTQIVGDRGVVVCPRGVALSAGSDDAYYFPDHHYLGRELEAILRSVKSALSELVDDGPIVYAGYSQGAIMGAIVARHRPSLLTRLVLIEGGAHEWDVPTAKKFRKGGGERVLLVCGHGGCAAAARRTVGWLERAGVEARAEHAKGAGHTFVGTVAERLRDTFDWVVEGDARWTAPRQRP